MTNLRAPPSRASSTFCLSSWRLPTISCPSTPTTTTPRLSFCRLKLMSAPPQSAAEAAARHRLLKQNHRQFTGRGRAGGLATGDVGHERGVALELAVEREIGRGAARGQDLERAAQSLDARP